MSMIEKKVKIVIGANFGDEGKGMMTDYFCKQAASRGERSLVICHNGGSQRGHTVVREDGVRHVFHHFGSGSFSGADTYLSEEFIVNPMVFRKEWEELKKIGCHPVVWMHPYCRITTPFDMIINQLIEEKRSTLRHGSCGMGIFETICRYKDKENRDREKQERELQESRLNLHEMFKEGKYYLCQIRDEYFPKRLEMLGIVMDEEWKSIVAQEGLILHYLDDLEWMRQKVKLADVSVFHHYDTLVFEGGQGLLLDQDNREYFPHLTPSSTGLKNPSKLLAQWISQDSSEHPCTLDTEVCYVTRPYLTRHGAGRLDTECSKEEINADMVDRTNVPNPYQGTMRYGRIELNSLKERIIRDFEKYKEKNGTCSLAVTHRNEVNEFFAAESNANSQAFFQIFHKLYFSDGEGADSVCMGNRYPSGHS